MEFREIALPPLLLRAQTTISLIGTRQVRGLSVTACTFNLRAKREPLFHLFFFLRLDVWMYGISRI